MIKRTRPFAGLAFSGVVVWSAFAVAQQAPTARSFDAGDSPAPFTPTHVDWASGEYKAQCSTGGPVMGLSAATEANGGQAHSILCKSPISGPFNFADTSNFFIQEEREDFSSGDSVGAREWDRGSIKGDCINHFVIGVAQTTDGRLGQLLCSDDCMMGLIPGTTCNLLTFPGDSPGLPDTQWADNYYKLECGANQLVVGMSVNPNTHRPHGILCCNTIAVNPNNHCT